MPRVPPEENRPRDIIDDTLYHVPRVAAPGPFRLCVGRQRVSVVTGQAALAAFVRMLAEAEVPRLAGPLQFGDCVPKLC